MRRMPQIQGAQKQPLMTTTFQGYNHNEIIADGEMFDEQNLSADLYPTLSPRKKRGITSYDTEGQTPVPLTGIHGRDQLVFIRGTEVFYNFVKVAGLSVSDDVTMLPKKIVSMGAYVCIWPDKVYFNTVNQSDCGSMDRLFSLTGSGISLNMCRGDGTNYDMTQITISASAPSSPTNGQLWIDQSGDVDVLRQYTSSTEEWVEVPSVYVKISGTGAGNGLSEYDAVEISGLEAPTGSSAKIKSQVDALNGSMIVYGAGQGYLIVAGLLSASLAALKANTVKIDRKVPDLDYICESNNRLWGCKYGLENGQVVNEIRASKLGDFRNWSLFMGLSTDSYTASIGTDGVFTGAITQKGYPVFFKENCIHRVSGSAPSSFQISTTICRGIQRGSWRSAVVVNEAIYYKSRQDIMVYDGSMPVSISTQLGKMLYEDARAGAIGGKYYISMKSRNGRWVQMCYDTEKALWHKEDELKALGYGTVADELFLIDEVNNTLVAVNGSMGDAESDFSWAAVFGMFGTDYLGKKYLSRFDIRMYLEEGSSARLWIRYDSDGKWEHRGEIRGRNLKNFLLPVVPRRCDHLQVKITGSGEMRIYSISRIMEVGSDV
ncbi:MAG: hypothetical protein II442_07135 [Oscillospiraceae bacterium]|nr:hypothetical protein [Oscillospiraceae bacterium]